jgi:hypothetical protein
MGNHGCELAECIELPVPSNTLFSGIGRNGVAALAAGLGMELLATGGAAIPESQGC